MYDTIIVGGGPAGVSAGVYLASRGKKTLILEKEQIGGLLSKVSTITHYTGIVENETGLTFAKRLENQVLSAGVLVKYENVVELDLKSEIKTIKTEKETYKAQKVILANGTTPRKLNIKGEIELDKKGIGLNALKDGEKYKNKNIYVVGGADGAIKEAIYLSQFAKNLTIIHFEKTLGCISEFKEKIEKIPNIKVKTLTRLNAVYGTDCVEKLELLSLEDNSITTIEDKGCGVFVYAGSTPNTSLYTDLELDENGFIKTNQKMETSLKNVYAAGDIISKQVRQCATAVSEGAIAGINAAQ